MPIPLILDLAYEFQFHGRYAYKLQFKDQEKILKS